MFEFTREQEAYIKSDISQHIFLEACPGSGKTEVVAAKVAHEVRSWRKLPGGVAALSFTNSATNELKNRVAKYLPIGSTLFPHFLGTFDSFIYKNIVSPLSGSLTGYEGENSDCSIRIVDGSSTLGFRTRWGIARQGNVCAHHYSMDLKNDRMIFDTGNAATDRALNAVVLEDWQKNDLTATKMRMLEAGYATYRDIEQLTLKALSESGFECFTEIFALRYPLVIIDECQDLSFEQLMILQKLSDTGVKLHFVGDLHQAIYGFRDVDPMAVKQFVTDNMFANLELTRNFRSCQKIINLCGALTGRNNIIGQLTQLETTCFLVQYECCPTEVIGAFEELCKDYQNVVIVARGHSMLQKFHTTATDLKLTHKLALAIKLFSCDDMELMDKSLVLFSEFICHYVDQVIKPNSFHCPQSIDSSLAWRKFLFLSLSHLTNNGLKDMDVDWSVWVRRAKPVIQELSDQCFVTDEVTNAIEPLNSANFRAPNGQAREQVNNFFGETTNTEFTHRKTTIHGAKGETHDVTILISTPDARGSSDSHWRKWLSSSNSEAARFAYVASSRPKHRLIWVVKKLKRADKVRFEELGFHIFPLCKDG